MKVLAIDPGNAYSGYCVIESDTLKPIEFGKIPNDELRDKLLIKPYAEYGVVAIEMVASYGMPVGVEVFDTVRWIGRYEEIMTAQCRRPPVMVKRIEEKLHICKTTRANDASIRRALIDRFARHDLKNGKGTKKDPDFFFGFKADIWAAYAVGLTCIETKMDVITEP